MNLCEAYCKNNKPCTRKKCDKNNYCNQHFKISGVKQILQIEQKLDVGLIINDNYIVKEQIFENQNTKCKVFKIQNINTNDFYILKEDIPRYIENEVMIYNLIDNQIGFPQLEYHTKNYIIMNDVGINISNYINLNGKLSNDLITKYGIQMIQRIEHLHSIGFIHRDIKLGNFTILNDIVYLIDFGVSYQYIIDYQHIENSHRVGFKGTKKYASVNALQNQFQSRRDDLESLGYVLMNLMMDLPWGNLTDKYDIIEMKEKLDLYDIPYTIKNFINYTKELKFDDKPDYKYLISLLMNL
jgi:serine/threonine protein kinase